VRPLQEPGIKRRPIRATGVRGCCEACSTNNSRKKSGFRAEGALREQAVGMATTRPNSHHPLPSRKVIRFATLVEMGSCQSPR
jgi:hypothetical protein